MSLSEVSIKRPVFATMLNIALIVFGLFSIPKLAVDQYPNVDFPVATVTIIYPGADPESIEQRILEPLEEAVNGISGLEKLSAMAFPNLGQIVLQFSLEKKSDEAIQDVRDRVFAAVGKLPVEAETPIVQKFDIGGAPILNVSLSGEAISIGELSALAKDTIQPRLQRVAGVGKVELAGSRLREIQILVDRKTLSSFGLTPADVIAAVKQNNLDMPVGKLESKTKFWTLRVKGVGHSASDISRLPIVSLQGSILRIGDVAQVVDTIEEESSAAFIGNSPTILLAVTKQSGGNTTAIAHDTIEAIDRLSKELPKGVKLSVVTDNSKFIKGSIDAVKLDLLIGAILAIIIVFLFLQNGSATLISAVALPTAVISTFAFMKFMNFTFNMMTTLALSLSIGILIDDAIVVIENIYRHMKQGKTPKQAAIDATSEIGLAVFATTMTICAVFVPVAFMEGIIGRFFYQFGLTVTFAVLTSLFVAFTLTPMLSSRYLKDEDEHREFKNPFLKFFWHKVNYTLDSIDLFYRKTLVWCLDHRGTTLLVGLATFILSFVLLHFVPVSFFAKEDRAQVSIAYTLPENTKLDVSKRLSLQMSDYLKKYPGVLDVVSTIGGGQNKKQNLAQLEVLLVDKTERTFTQDDFVDRLRDDLSSLYAINGAELSITDGGQQRGGAAYTQKIQLIFKGKDWDKLLEFTEQVASYIKNEVKDSIEVTTTKPKPQDEYRLIVDPARAADMGLSTVQLASSLRSLYEGDKIGEIEDNTGKYDIRLRVNSQDRTEASDLASVALTTRRGEQVTVGSVADIRNSFAPSVIERFDGQRQVTVLANFKGKDLNGAITQIESYVDKNIPLGLSMSLSGEAEIMKKSIVSMITALMLAILLIYMILCAQYERFLAPFVIMMALPLSFTGAFLALLITQQVISVFTMIGIILLMGIVTKNGILLIDFTLQRIEEGLSIKEALLEAGPIRLRPILMTTFAAGFGMLPIALGHGVGGEIKAPMGVAVIGGLLASTFLTLVVVPCLFSLMEGLKREV